MLDRSDPDRPIASTTQLADGSTYLIRAQSPDDRELLLSCFAALSPRSWRLRFFMEKSALTPEELERFLKVDGHDHIAFVAIRLDARGQELEPLGFARCQRLKPGGEIAELSMVTLDQVQGMGVGFALLSRLIVAAQRQGIDRFWFEVLMENNGMRRLAQKIHSQAQWADDGTLEYDCLLADALPAVLPAAAPNLEPQPPAKPARPEPSRDWPWYLDPVFWMEPWTETWRSDLANYLSLLEAANEDASHWLEWQGPLPLYGQTWRAAA